MTETTRKKIAKIIFMGDVNFSEEDRPPVEGMYFSRQVTMEERTVRLQYWDTAGLDRTTLGTVYFRSTDCCMLCFDLTSLQSFRSLDDWLKRYKMADRDNDTTPVPLVLAADCREATKGVPGFRETTRNGLICFNYDFATKHSFPNPNTAEDAKTSFLLKVRRECRGIIFEVDTGLLVCRKFHKFFNINEMEETSQDNIDIHKSHIIMEKLDGSLIAPILFNNVLSWGSKAGLTELGSRIDKYILSKKDVIDYNGFAEHWIKKGYTPMFEYCSESQRIVLYYAVDLLSLTAIRNNVTGEYLLYDELVESGKQFNVPVARKIDVSTIPQLADCKNAADMLVAVQLMQNIEGYILRFDDGTVYKMKCTWYFDLSKSSSMNLNAEKDIWMLILDNKLDDTVASLCTLGPLPERYLKIQAFAKELFDTVEALSRRIIEYLIEHKKHSKARKDIQMDKTLTAAQKKVVYDFHDIIDYGDDVDEHLSKVSKHIIYNLKSHCSSSSKLEEARTMLNGLKYVE
eukprot:gene13703-16152_t